MYILLRTLRLTRQNTTVMNMEDSRTQRPYRYGMILLCLGAIINWLGLSETSQNGEPIRYLGVACILGGALLICTAMCCWLHTPNRTSDSSDENDDPIHVIAIADERRREKPPDYDQVTSAPPSYDDAIKLDPSALLSLSPGNSLMYLPTTNNNQSINPSTTSTSNTVFSISNELNSNNNNSNNNNNNNNNNSRPSSSSYMSNMIINKLRCTNNNQSSTEKSESVEIQPPPPPYTTTAPS